MPRPKHLARDRGEDFLGDRRQLRLDQVRDLEGKTTPGLGIKPVFELFAH
jgi:hypothetical protein